MEMLDVTDFSVSELPKWSEKNYVAWQKDFYAVG